MDREVEVMKETVAGDQEVALELEEHPGMVGPGIRLEKCSDWVCFFFYDLRSGTQMNCWCR